MIYIANCYSNSWSFIKSVPFEANSRDGFPEELSSYNIIITDENGEQV